MVPKRIIALLSTLFVLGVGILPNHSQPASASHLCSSTGSPFGSLTLETYEASGYRYTYARTMELAGLNRLFPDQPAFTPPRLETGSRDAGSGIKTDPYIPPVILKAIAWIESNWAQASYDPLVQYGEVGPVLVSHDCGYGLMQITTGMQNVSGVPSLEQAMIGGHYAYNVARGAQILADKWNQAPEYRPLVGNRDPSIIENWYYALWSYNGFAWKNHPLNGAYDPNRPPYDCAGMSRDRPYQELVLGCVANPPARGGVRLWDPAPVHLPDLNDPVVRAALDPANWNNCSYYLQCAAMDIPTPNPFHQDPASPNVDRQSVIGLPSLSLSAGQFYMSSVPPVTEARATLTLFNAGTGVLSWRATSSASWLKLSRFQGVATGADIGARPSELVLRADGVGIPPGQHTAQVTVASAYAGGVPQTIWVTFDNYPDGTLLVGPNATVYRMQGGLRRAVPDLQTFVARGLDWARIMTLPGDAMANIPEGFPLPSVIARGSLIKGSGGTVYVMEGGAKRPLAGAGLIDACGYGWDSLTVLPDSLVDPIPTGSILYWLPCPGRIIRSGALAKGTAATVFTISSGLKRAFSSPLSLEAGGYRWGNLDGYPDSVLDDFPDGKFVLDAWMNGTLLKGSGATVYVMQDRQRRPITGVAVVDACGYSWDSIRTVSDATLSGVPVGPNLSATPCPAFRPPTGTLLQGSDATVYVMESGARRPIAGPDIFNSCGYRWGDIDRIPDGQLNGIPPAALLSSAPCPQ